MYINEAIIAAHMKGKTDIYDCKPIYIYRKMCGKRWYLKITSMDTPYVKYNSDCVKSLDQGLSKNDILSCDWDVWVWQSRKD